MIDWCGRSNRMKAKKTRRIDASQTGQHIGSVTVLHKRGVLWVLDSCSVAGSGVRNPPQ